MGITWSRYDSTVATCPRSALFSSSSPSDFAFSSASAFLLASSACLLAAADCSIAFACCAAFSLSALAAAFAALRLGGPQLLSMSLLRRRAVLLELLGLGPQ